MMVARSSGLGITGDLCRGKQQSSSDDDDRTCHCECILSVIELYSSHTAGLNLHLAGKNEGPVFALLSLFHVEEVLGRSQSEVPHNIRKKFGAKTALAACRSFPRLQLVPGASPTPQPHCNLCLPSTTHNDLKSLENPRKSLW
jgi:hypothetical protein